MPVFTIQDDTATAYTAEPTASIDPNAIVIRSADDLTASTLSTTRLAALWSNLPGTTPLKTFKTRAIGIRRLWDQLQTLPVTPVPTTDAPGLTAQALDGPAAHRARPDSKQAQVVALIGRPDGATLGELMAATGWQRHTVRGAIAGALKKGLGLDIQVMKRTDGQRAYHLASGVGAQA